MKPVLPALLLLLPLQAALPTQVTPNSLHRLSRVGLEIASGEIQLPARLRQATLRPASGDTLLESPMLVPQDPEAAPRRRYRSESLLDGEAPLAFRVIARVKGRPAPGASASLDLVSAQGKVLQRLTFPIPTKVSEDLDPARGWAAARLWHLGGPLRPALLASAQAAYGLAPDLVRTLERRARQEADPAGPSFLALLGGRAAVDETLQLDRELEVRENTAAKATAEVPLSALKPVETPAHPWAEMRKGTAVRVPLADLVPKARAALFLPRPKEALASFEQGGSSFLNRVNSFGGDASMETSIVTRLMDDLGLGSGLGRRLVDMGAIRHVAVFLTDLSLVAGTEATLLAELDPIASALLPISEGPVTPRTTPGGQAFWARRGRHILLSTSATEIQRALELAESHGKDSLGASDEFAVVLQHLAPDAQTEAFAYLSDGFIRRLIGPRQRILQARQAQARGEMELLAAARLLRRMDAPGETPALGRLRELGYLPSRLNLEPFSMDAEGRIRHRVYGALDRLTPLERIPLTQVTAAEQEAYERFREGYDQYWRKFFDPIALRLNAGPGTGMALETFVLPLLEHSLYAPFRRFLPEGDPQLVLPQWNHPMVATLGLKMSADGLQELQRSGSRLLGNDIALPFTGTVAVAFPDGAPVLQVGNGNPAALMDSRLGREAGLLSMAAVGLGLFTRPMALAFELAPGAQPLEDMAALPMPSRDLRLQTVLEPDGRRIVTLDFLGMVGMRFTLHQEGRWLVVTNDISLPSPLVGANAPATPFHASFQIHPGALRQGLPAAWQVAMEGEARAAWAAQQWLSPWLQAGFGVPEAQAASLRLLGQAPKLNGLDLHPDGSSRRFGTPAQPLRPPFDPSRDFGLFEGVKDPKVEMRLEGDGLRARVTWQR